MGYMPAPGIHAGPVPLVPGPELRSCGHEYQEGPPSADLGLCDCGMAAVARCVDCGGPLCGMDLRRRGGQVLCATDVQARESAEEADRFRDSLDKLVASARSHSDPTARALFLYVHGPIYPRYEPNQGPRGDDAKAIADTVRNLLTHASPVFRYQPGNGWVQLSSPAALAKWAFAHPNAPRPEALRVVKILQYVEWLKIPRGSVPGLRIAEATYEAPTGDFRTGTSKPATYLLEDGRIGVPYNGYIEEQHLTTGSEADWKALARTLGIVR